MSWRVWVPATSRTSVKGCESIFSFSTQFREWNYTFEVPTYIWPPCRWTNQASRYLPEYLLFILKCSIVGWCLFIFTVSFRMSLRSLCIVSGYEHIATGSVYLLFIANFMVYTKNYLNFVIKKNIYIWRKLMCIGKLHDEFRGEIELIEFLGKRNTLHKRTAIERSVNIRACKKHIFYLGQNR